MDILARGGTQAGLVDLTTAAREKALKIIREGREAGQGSDEIARNLEDAVPAGPFLDWRTRADLIARTETRVAQTESALMMYRSTEGIQQVMIIDARLGDTDAECEAMNGTLATFDEAEGLIADEHPNGTRDIVPVI
jgi:SPP1 gp7 family putative phage head morphogenesis protein